MCEVLSNENVVRNYYSHIPFDLCTATSIGDSDWVRQLLMLPRIRGQLNVPNKGGWTPTMYSAYLGHHNILLLLIQNGAEVNVINSEGQTALMLAVKCGNLTCCEILLTNGAIVDAVDSHLYTALAYAVSAGYDDVTQFLIKHNANVNMKLGENQMTPIMFAAKAGHEKVVPNKGDWTPTMYSAYYGHDNILLQLIQNGAEVNVINSKGQTALMLAVKCGNLICCEILLKNGAIVDAVDSHLYTALAYAVSAGYDDVTQFLIKHNSNVNMKLGENQMTPIMFAAKAGHEKIVKILMDAGANPHTKSAKGVTACSLAFEKGHFEVVNLLGGCQSRAFSYDPFPKGLPKKYLDANLPVRTTSSPMSPSQLELPFPSDLPTLLQSLGLSEYNQFFEKQNIKLQEFLQLSNENLKDLGIDKFGPRIKMSKAISRLTSEVLLPNSPIQKVSANKQQLEIESLKQRLAKSEAQLLQERILVRSENVGEGLPLQIQNAFLPLSNLEWQSDTLKGFIKSLRDQVLSERSKLDNDLASELLDKVLDIDRLTTEIQVQVGAVLKSLNNATENSKFRFNE